MERTDNILQLKMEMKTFLGAVSPKAQKKASEKKCDKVELPFTTSVLRRGGKTTSVWNKIKRTRARAWQEASVSLAAAAIKAGTFLSV